LLKSAARSSIFSRTNERRDSATGERDIAALQSSPPHPKIPPMNAPSSPQTPWTNVRHGWQQLYGSFEKMGISIEWHDFKTSKPLDWAESFRPGSIRVLSES
jgi:hypothetical protein